MIALLGFYLLAITPVAVLGEVGLLAARKLNGISWRYVGLAAALRGILYAPVLVGVGHGGAVIPLPIGILLNIASDADIVWISALSLIPIAAVSSGLSRATHSRRLFHGKSANA